MKNQPTLTVGEAANYLQVSTTTLRRWDTSGKLVAYRTPGNARRYTLAQLEQAIALPAQTEE